MSRILLVDDSPHAQRMGERILTEEGYEVVTVSNADSALIRLDDVDPDVVLADIVMPGRTGYDICYFLKMSPRHRHVKVILTAGALEPLDEEQVKRVEADATLKKPFEASALIATVRPLALAAAAAQTEKRATHAGTEARGAGKSPAVPFVAVVDAEQVRAAVTIALDASMANMVDEIAGRVLSALQSRKPELPAVEPAPAVEPLPVAVVQRAAAEALPPVAPLPPDPLPPAPQAVLPQPAQRIQTVRKITPVRLRSNSVLGLEIGHPEPEPLEPGTE